MSDNCDIGLPLTRYVLIKATLYLVLTLHIQSSLLTDNPVIISLAWRVHPDKVTTYLKAHIIILPSYQC